MDDTITKISFFVGLVIFLAVGVGILGATSDTTNTAVNLLTSSTDGEIPTGANGKSAIVSGYHSQVAEVSATMGLSNSAMYILMIEPEGRVRQDGTITGVTLTLASSYDRAEIDSWDFEVWRKDGATYDLVGKTGDVKALVAASGGGETTINFSPGDYITGVKEGDFIAIGITATSIPNNSFLYAGATSEDAPAHGGEYYYDIGVPSATNFDWDAGSTWTGWCVCQMVMASPNIVYIGDSITEGSTLHVNYIRNSFGATHDPTVTFPYKASKLLGVTHQNMGWFGQISANLVSRFTEDVVDLNATSVIIAIGTNDVNSAVPLSTFSSNIVSMITEAQAAGITPILLEIYPRNDFNNTDMATTDTFNQELRDLAVTYGIKTIDPRPYIGEERVGGSPTPPVGNLWDLQAAYNLDGTHLTEAGNTQVASAIAAADIGIGASSWSVLAAQVDATSQASYSILYLVVIVLAAVIVLAIIRQLS